jgi:hypothetical protein
MKLGLVCILEEYVESGEQKNKEGRGKKGM